MFANWFMIVFIGCLALGIVAQVVAGIREKRAEKLAQDIEDIEPGDKVLIKKDFTLKDVGGYKISAGMDAIRGKVVKVTFVDFYGGDLQYGEWEGCSKRDVFTPRMIAKVIKAGEKQ